MGLISLVKGALGGAAANVANVAGTAIETTIKDQYKEFFTCDSLGQEILVRRGAARKSTSNGKNLGDSEVITNGSVIAVPEGTALLLVDGGQVIDFTTEPGYYQWDSSSSPSVFSEGKFLDNAKAIVKEAWQRMQAGGEITKQQRVYFVNMLEIRNQKFGTPSALPYNDPEYRNIYIRLNGMFSYKIQDPITFFKTQCGNVASVMTCAEFMGTPADPKQPRVEFLDNFSEVLNKCGGQDKIMFANLPTEQGRLRKYMQDELDQEWLQKRGIVVETVAIGGITPDDKSRQRIEDVDNAKMYAADPSALAAQAVLGQTEAMKAAGANANGAVNGFMGLGMMQGAAGAQGGTAAAFNFLGQQQQMQAQQQAAAPAAAAAGWTCSCGAVNTGKFCSQCGQPQPAPAAAAGWTCSCGAVNTGKFCSECGSPAPAAAPTACPNCGFKPADGVLGKFCPECGNKIQ